MKHRNQFLLWGFLILALGGFGACKSKPKSQAQKPPKNLKTYTLVYGGDFTFGRRLNDALFDAKARADILGNVAPLFKAADIALANGEGVVANGGYFFDKGEPRPHMYRAHPLAIDVLKENGMDVITVGNNHFGDYGPEAMAEMLARLRKAGIDYAGGGVNKDDARTPAYVKVGDVVVAFVGGDFTLSKAYRAKKDRAGILYHNAFRDDRNEDDIVEDLEKILEEARKYAHLVILSPHWGDNWKEDPGDHIRSLGKRIIEIGYDAIIGHSAHLYQGVELVDGKPIIYDAGNLVSDFGPPDNSRFGMAWKLDFNMAGIKRIEGYPILLKRAHTVYVEGKNRDRVLKDVVKKSEKMDTTLEMKDGKVALACAPGYVRMPSENSVPVRPVPKKIPLAPNDTVIDALPKRATPINVTFENGISLIGYELVTDLLQVPKAGQVVQLYWRVPKKISGDYKVRLEAKHTHPETGRERWTNTEHIPGDWLLPVEKWPAGKVIRDWSLFRLKFHPDGEVAFYAGLIKDKRKLKPESSDRPVENETGVYLGKARYDKKAKRLFHYVKEYRKIHPEK